MQILQWQRSYGPIIEFWTLENKISLHPSFYDLNKKHNFMFDNVKMRASFKTLFSSILL